ncbi:MAG: hypothetical protein ACOCV2_04290, partial [Persicimonas sp.]
MRRLTTHCATLVLAAAVLLGAPAGCGFEGPEELDENTHQVQPLLNAPGTNAENDRDRLASDFLIQQIDEARTSLDVAIYGFSQ